MIESCQIELGQKVEAIKRTELVSTELFKLSPESSVEDHQSQRALQFAAAVAVTPLNGSKSELPPHPAGAEIGSKMLGLEPRRGGRTRKLGEALSGTEQNLVLFRRVVSHGMATGQLREFSRTPYPIVRYPNGHHPHARGIALGQANTFIVGLGVSQAWSVEREFDAHEHPRFSDWRGQAERGKRRWRWCCVQLPSKSVI